MTTKVCTKCFQEKDIEEFPWKSMLRGKRHAVCKECTAKRSGVWYENNKERQLEYVNNNRRRYRDLGREYVWTYLSTHPCIRCGQSNPHALEFHHARGNKEAEVSRLIGLGSSLDRLIAEIEKCDVLCASCHRIITAEEQGWYKGPSEK
jgi:hypothetical protein